MTSAGAPTGGSAGSGSSSNELHSITHSSPVISQLEHKIGQITLADGRKMDVFILLKDESGSEMNFPTNFKHKAKIEKLCQKIIDELSPPADAKDIRLSNTGLTYIDSAGVTQMTHYTAGINSKGHRLSNYWWDKTIFVIQNNTKKGFGTSSTF